MAVRANRLSFRWNSVWKVAAARPGVLLLLSLLLLLPLLPLLPLLLSVAAGGGFAQRGVQAVPLVELEVGERGRERERWASADQRGVSRCEH